MSLVSRAIQSLFNGVSQQPASLRHPSQCELQVNAHSSLANGLIKRPPAQHAAKVSALPVGSAYVHTINRDLTERYEVIVTDGDLKVYDLLTGTEKTVAFPDGKTYLSATTPDDSFAAVTVADYTFICNKTVKVALDAATGGGTLLGTKQAYADLPTTGNTDGDVWEIAGDPTNSFDNFYLMYDGTAAVWVETVEPGLQNTLDAATMPHQLVREADGTFTFQQATWATRGVGDLGSAPAPSFVGRTLADVLFHKDRLGVLSDESVVLSRASDYFNFWPETVTAVLDSDPIDVTASNVKVSILHHAVPFNESLLLFSDQTQFVLSSSNGQLSSKTVTLTPSTEFESSNKAKPVGAGQDVFFVTNAGDHDGLREYFVSPDTVTNDAADVTAHIPRYIPEGTRKLAASTNLDVLFALTSASPSRIYVYKYYWSGQQKVQSSWSYWEMDAGDSILNIDMVGTRLYLTVERSDGVYLEYVDLGNDPSYSVMGFTVHLDRRVSLTGSYDSGTNTTTWTLPYAEDADMVAVLSADFAGRLGEALNITRPSSTTVAASGDLSGGNVYLGRTYTMKYRFSEQFIREAKTSGGGREHSVLAGRLQLRSFSVRYEDSGYFTAVVTPLYRDPYTYTFTGKTLGAGSLVLGKPGIEDGTFKFPVMSHSAGVAVELQNDSFLPSKFVSAEWEGFFVIRSKRL